jgi:hypothetical protein
METLVMAGLDGVLVVHHGVIGNADQAGFWWWIHGGGHR